MASSVTAAPQITLPRARAAFEGPLADVLALAAGHSGQYGEHDAERVVGAFQLALKELQGDVVGAQLLGKRSELDAAAEPLVLVHYEDNRGAGGADLGGQGYGLVQLGPDGHPRGDLLGEDPGDARGAQHVEPGVKRLAGGRRTGVPDPHVPRRGGTACCGAGQFGPRRARLPQRRDRHGEGPGQAGHEPEPGGVVLRGYLAPARAAR
jgi:hypothetical protein